MTISNEERIIMIIYVQDQEKSKQFYEQLLGLKPYLDVPGMTEFQLNINSTLGIMPEDGIVRLLDGKIQNPKEARGIPRSEIYIYVNDPDTYLRNLVVLGGMEISKGEIRNWGDYVAYGSDIDGHIIAFARRT